MMAALWIGKKSVRARMIERIGVDEKKQIVTAMNNGIRRGQGEGTRGVEELEEA